MRILLFNNCLLLLALFCLPAQTQSQTITLTEFPETYQLYPREQDNLAEIDVSGTVNNPTANDSLVFHVRREGQSIDRRSRALTVFAPENRFSFRFKLPAELANYSFELRLVGPNRDEQLGFADSVVAGDVIILNGQSNACEYGSSQIIVNQFCRTFGMGDQGWNLANHVNKVVHNTGILGFAIQDYLSRDLNIPVCMINGAISGSWMGIQVPNPENRADMETIYGRMLDRLERSGTKNHARALFWYLGEAETGRGIENYLRHWDLLYQAWQKDFPAIERFYIYQIRPGCVETNETHAQVREAQRLLDSVENVQVISTCGRPGFKGCHYKFEGYLDMARNSTDLLLEQIYNVNTNKPYLKSPNIKRACYSSPAKDRITLEFDTALDWPFKLDSNGARLRDYFLLDGRTAQAEWGTAVGPFIYLTLREPSDATQITYLPNVFYDEVLHGRESVVYQGPFLRNPAGVGALSFLRFPIDEFSSDTREFKQRLTIDGATTLCPDETTTISAPEGFEIYIWSNGMSGREISVAGRETDLGLLAIDADNNYSAGSVAVRLDTAPAPRLSFDETTGRLHSNVVARDYIWFRNDEALTPLQGLNSIVAPDSANYRVEVEYLNGCRAASNVLMVVPKRTTGVTLTQNSRQKLRLYPNPTQNTVNFIWEHAATSNTQIYLRDTFGRTVQQHSRNVLQFNDKVSLDVKTLAAGVYYLTIDSPDQTTSVMLLKQ